MKISESYKAEFLQKSEEIIAGLGPIYGRLLTEGYEGSAETILEAGEMIRELGRVIADE